MKNSQLIKSAIILASVSFVVSQAATAASRRIPEEVKSNVPLIFIGEEEQILTPVEYVMPDMESKPIEADELKEDTNGIEAETETVEVAEPIAEEEPAAEPVEYSSPETTAELIDYQLPVKLEDHEFSPAMSQEEVVVEQQDEVMTENQEEEVVEQQDEVVVEQQDEVMAKTQEEEVVEQQDEVVVEQQDEVMAKTQEEEVFEQQEEVMDETQNVINNEKPGLFSRLIRKFSLGRESDETKDIVITEIQEVNTTPAENYIQHVKPSQVITTHDPVESRSTNDVVAETPALGVVSEVKSTAKGPFKQIGPYSVNDRDTGLLLPIGDNNTIKTSDHQIEVMLKQPALMSIDKRSSVRLVKVLDIHELMVEKGRVRIKLVENSGLWTVRGRDISLSLNPMADVIVDMTGSLITRVFILEGSAYCMESTGKKPNLVEAGEHMSIGLNDSLRSQTKDGTIEYLKTYLTLSDVENKERDVIAAAHAFHREAFATWPVANKFYSGVMCTNCSYAFGKEEEAFTHCPECHVSLITKKQTPTDKQKLNSNPWILGLSKVQSRFIH